MKLSAEVFDKKYVLYGYGLHFVITTWLPGKKLGLKQGKKFSAASCDRFSRVSTRSMGHHAMTIWGWLEISKTNVRLYTISKPTCTLFEGV